MKGMPQYRQDGRWQLDAWADGSQLNASLDSIALSLGAVDNRCPPSSGLQRLPTLDASVPALTEASPLRLDDIPTLKD